MIPGRRPLYSLQGIGCRPLRPPNENATIRLEAMLLLLVLLGGSEGDPPFSVVAWMCKTGAASFARDACLFARLSELCVMILASQLTLPTFTFRRLLARLADSYSQGCAYLCMHSSLSRMSLFSEGDRVAPCDCENLGRAKTQVVLEKRSSTVRSEMPVDGCHRRFIYPPRREKKKKFVGSHLSPGILGKYIKW